MDDWETGLPSTDDITPLCHSLIPPELASAFKISSHVPKTMIDVNRASQTTFSSLRSSIPNFNPSDHEPEHLDEGGSNPKRIRESEEDSTNDSEKDKGKAAKRARLVWTPQLHKRFVEVVAHLGLKNAVPKTIMHLMNVEGLSRENVASHLQKYRLYVKRMQGFPDDDPSPSDQLFASTPLPPSRSVNESSRSQGNGSSYGNRTNGSNNSYSNDRGSHGEMQMPVLPVPMIGMGQGKVDSTNFHGYEDAGNSQHHHHHHHHHHYERQYHSNMVQHQREWSGNAYSTHMTQSNK